MKPSIQNFDFVVFIVLVIGILCVDSILAQSSIGVGVRNLDAVTGAFDITVTVRFTNVAGGRFQRIIDFGNGPQQDNIILGQSENSRNMEFVIIAGSKQSSCVAGNVIIQDEVATWKAGVYRNGTQWLEKNGIRVCTLQQGTIPRNIIRSNMYIGHSNTLSGHTPLKGTILGIDITNENVIRHGLWLNKPDQIQGHFSVTVYARFDAPQSGRWQRIFEFGGENDDEYIWFGQRSNRNDIAFQITRDENVYRLIAPNAIVTGELAKWKVSVDINGIMSIEKSGTLLVTRQGVLPIAIQRNSNLVGSSYDDDSDPLDGVVLGLTVSPAVTVPTLIVVMDD